MFKVIVERPRWGRAATGGSDYPRGRLRNAWRPKRGADLEAAPLREGMGSRLSFYVCPRSGLLRLAPVVARKRRRLWDMGWYGGAR
jgi:hypothetical protein